ncbi:MAG: hypothetical protein ACI9OJ_004220, partial [Myxococcota bacterium]
MIQTLLQVALSASAALTSGPGNDDPKTFRGTAADLEVVTPAVERADISIDGRLDDTGWQDAAILSDFTQFEPVEGTRASQATEIRVLVDADAIYFSVIAYDDNPSDIRATLSERDSYTRSDDYVRFVLDTFDDARRAFVFTVNPLGVQHDGIWNQGGSSGRRGGFGPPIDDNPDFLWESNGQITDSGYQAEVRIPFKSLRFSEVAEQAWGLQVERSVQRTGYRSSWAPITADIANRLAQSGKLTGLRNLDMGMFLELNPVVTGRRIGGLDSETGVFQHDATTGDFGVNATYGLTSNLTLDGTYNPDFSQVEADAGQISVNERFALFFPEKRPFFLEGTEIFAMPKQLIYTRRVANPIGGAKLTGKIGSLSVGYLGALDESFDVGADNTIVNLVRVKNDVGSGSSIGAVYTDRSVSTSDYNRVAGADATLQLTDRYTLTLMGATSFTGDPETGRERGRLLHAKFEQAGTRFSFNAEVEDTDPEFNTASGFLQRIGETQASSRTEYNWFGRRGSLVERVGPSVEAKGYWDHDGFWDGAGPEEAEVQLGWRIGFRGNITFWGNHKRTKFDFSPASYEGLFGEQADGSFVPFRPDQSLFDNLGSTTLSLWVNKWQAVRGNIRYTFSDTPIFDRSYGVAIEPARSRSMETTINLYPMRALVAEVGLRTNTLDRKRDGSTASEAIIPRVRAQYQFSRSLFVRGIFEYRSQERFELRDPASGLGVYSSDEAGGFSLREGSIGHDFHFEGLVSY